MIQTEYDIVNSYWISCYVLEVTWRLLILVIFTVKIQSFYLISIKDDNLSFQASLQYFSGDHEKHNCSFGWFCFRLLLIKNMYLSLATQVTFCFSTDSSRSATISGVFFMRLMSVGIFTFHVTHMGVSFKQHSDLWVFF